MCGVKVGITLTAETIADQNDTASVMELVHDLMIMEGTYEKDLQWFKYAMGLLLKTLEDPKAPSDVILEIDETVKEWYDEFRSVRDANV